MNPEIKQRWVEALRSGKYVQGSEALKKSDGRMCCLGVLCNLAAADGIGEWRGPYNGQFEFTDPAIGTTNAGYLIPLVSNWAGLESHNPELQFLGENHRRLATVANDSGKFSFDQIADAIEASL